MQVQSGAGVNARWTGRFLRPGSLRGRLVSSEVYDLGPRSSAAAAKCEAGPKQKSIAVIYFRIRWPLPTDNRKSVGRAIAGKISTYAKLSRGRKRKDSSSTFVPYYDLFRLQRAASAKAATQEKRLVPGNSGRLRLTPNRKSAILTEEMLESLGTKMSLVYRMEDWEVMFAISEDGVSLRTFFHSASTHNPSVILVKDSEGGVFGAFASEQWHEDSHYYGTGESFLFKFVRTGEKVETVVYRWTGENSLILYSSLEKIAVGGGYLST